MLTILIAPDKFKGSLSALEVSEAIKNGVSESRADTLLETLPLADGGEGTCELLTRYSNGVMVPVETVDPLMRKLTASYGMSRDGSMAFIEMAAASGLHLLKLTERNPLYTSTAGTGILIRHALMNGAKKIVLAIGGSATNDAGTGMASALGFSFLDKHGKEIVPRGESLGLIDQIRKPVPGTLPDFDLTVLCDVSNPLFGEDGAAFVYGPQKRADPATVSLLDEGLRHFAGVVLRDYDQDLNFPGAGAAGGLGAGAKFFLNGTLCSGIRYVMDLTSLEKKISRCDLVISGEGKLDSQSLSGKVVDGVSELCRKHHKALWIVTGKNELTVEEQKQLGVSKILALMDQGVTVEIAMAQAAELIREMVKRECVNLNM